jgi:hypothetical protein
VHERGRYREEGRPRHEEERRREHPREDDRRRPFGAGQEEGSPSRGARRGRGRERNGGSPDRRSPTPVGTVPISQRKRKASGWDVHAPGYEQYSAMQAKQTGVHRLMLCLSAGANTPTQGCSTFLARIAHRFRLFWLSPAFRRQCLFPRLAWVWQ